MLPASRLNGRRSAKEFPAFNSLRPELHDAHTSNERLCKP